MLHMRAITVAVVIALTAAYLLESIALAAVSCTLLMVMFLKKSSDNRRITTTDVEDSIHPLLIKAWQDFREIEAAQPRLRDKVLAEQVMCLQEKAERILAYLNDHQQNIPAANRFINYYQDRTAALVEQCASLETAGIATPKSKEIMHHTATILAGFEDAYEKQFARIVDMQLLDMDAELKVANQELAGEGIDCNKSALRRKSVSAKVSMLQSESSSPTHKGRNLWQPKAIGAVLLTVLGGYGIYQFFNQDKD